MSHFSKYLRISKIDDEKQSVWGYASTPALDSDDEIVDLDAIKAALPGYLEWGNIREMHKSSAVGVAIDGDTQVDEKGLWLGARIVDPLAWQKVKEKVYKGFSIGGEIIKKVGKRITELSLIEISLVDRPANPECKIEVVKFDKGKPSTEALLRFDDITKGYMLNAVDVDWSTVTEDEAKGFSKFLGGLFRMFKSGDGLSSPAGRVTNIDPEGHTHPAIGVISGVPQTMPDPGNSIHDKGDAKKPYGDVTYADPGYQSDGKHRYPIDTPRHIRAAWNYIHKPHNRTPYSAEQVSHIEHAIVAAWKEHIDKEGPPAAASEKFAKMIADDEEDVAAVLEDTDPVVFAKHMGGVGMLAYAFGSIRDAQRFHVLEAKIEGDADDLAVAHRLGEVGKTLSEVIADIALHEGQEGITMTDIEDIRYRPPWPYDRESISITIEEPAMNIAASADAVTLLKSVGIDVDALLKTTGGSLPMVAKRTSSKAHHAAKAVEHLAECVKCHKAMHGHINALHKIHKDHAIHCKEAAATAKAAPEFPAHEALGHMQNIMAHHLKMADHHDLAHSHMSLCAGEGMGPGDSGDGWTAPGGVTDMPHGHTEGSVPGLNDGSHAQPGKAAEPTLTKALEDAAYWRGQAEALSRMPAPRGSIPSTFDVSKINTSNGSVVQGKTPQQQLMDGVDMAGIGEQTGAAKAAGKMIGNMIANGFGKNPITDNSFRGGAAG